MKNTMKNMTAIRACLILAFSLMLFACGGGGGEGSGSETSPSNNNDAPASGETVINGRA